MSHNSYKITFRKDRNSFKISAPKITCSTIADFLTRRNCFIKYDSGLSSQSLEIDHTALEILMAEGAKINVVAQNEFDKKQLALESQKEKSLAQKLKEKNYNLNLRIWSKEVDDKITYYSEVGSNIYSCDNLDNLISLLHGEYLVESNKPITKFSANPFTVFGVFDVAQDALSSNKSLIHYNFRDKENKFSILGGSRKKQFNPVLEHIDHLKIVIDGADDTATALNNTGLPQQTVALLQGLLIFPIFLKGVHLGYEGLGDEAKETHEAYREAEEKKSQILANLEKFKEEICQICNIDYKNFLEISPQDFLKNITDKLEKIQHNPSLSKEEKEEKLNSVTNLTTQYQRELETEIEAPEIKDVLAAYTGWLAMTSMMTSVAVYEGQAIINIFGGVKDLSTTSGNNFSILSQAGNQLGFVGQCLMTIYAFHKMLEEHKEWKEVEAELKQFQSTENVSELAQKITSEILKEKRDNHKIQTFGSAALSIGQAAMAISGPIGLGLNPMLYAGLTATLVGVAANSFSELRYQTSYKIDENIDALEQEILTTKPNFSLKEFSNPSEAVEKHVRKQISTLEVLGHLRAPQLVLYQNFVEENKDDSGIITQSIMSVFGNKIAKWINNPPQHSTNLIKDNPKIKANLHNPNDLEIFTVEKSDLELALKKFEELQKQGKSHEEIVKTIQEDFIDRKAEISKKQPPKSVKEICSEILQKDSIGASYLRKKLLRAVANNNLQYGSNLAEENLNFEKNGEKIKVAKLDLDKFREEELSEFLNKKRPQKQFASGQKKSVIEKSHQEELYKIKSDHLRPFFEIAKASNVGQNVIASMKEKQSSPLVLKEKGGQDNLLEKFVKLIKEKCFSNKKERETQVQEQNKMAQEITQKSHQFLLESKTQDEKKEKTIFVFIDPDHQNPKDSEYEARKVIYIQDNISNKIDVIYGEKSRALILEPANENKNAAAIKIFDGKEEFLGDKTSSNFVSFTNIKKAKSTPNSTTKPLAKTFELIKSQQSLEGIKTM